MGSSYAAGYDINPQEPDSSPCDRSLIDYPHLVADKLQLRLDDVSCGGAVTANALNTPQGHQPPQIVAYPRLVPSKPCAALNYTPSAAEFVAEIGMRLERVFVNVAQATHIRFADPYVLGATHGPCSGSNRWVVGLVPDNGAPYHPTAAGHREMARLVERALR
jgi:hypothetical protein